MSYQVSENIQAKVNAIAADEAVQKALNFMVEDHDTIVEKQCELALIPAPTANEAAKAARMLEMFKEEGLDDQHDDHREGQFTNPRKHFLFYTLFLLGFLDFGSLIFLNRRFLHDCILESVYY